MSAQGEVICFLCAQNVTMNQKFHCKFYKIQYISKYLWNHKHFFHTLWRIPD